MPPGGNGASAVFVDNERQDAYVAEVTVLQGLVSNYTVTDADGHTKQVTVGPGDTLPLWIERPDVRDVEPAGGRTLATRQRRVGGGTEQVLLSRLPHAPGTTVLVVVRTAGLDGHVVAAVARRCWPGMVDRVSVELTSEGHRTSTDCRTIREWLPLIRE